jgi:hypothetical protein
MFGSHGWRLLALVVAVALAGQALGQERPDRKAQHLKKIAKLLGRPAKAAPSDGGELQRLLHERLVVAGLAYEAAARQYAQGLGSLQDMMRETRRLLVAELATKTTPQGRIAVLEKAVAVARENEKLIREMVDAGGAAQILLQDAQYERLTAQINLLRAKAEAGAPK